MRKLVVFQWLVIGLLLGAFLSTAMAQSSNQQWQVEVIDEQPGYVDLRVYPPVTQEPPPPDPGTAVPTATSPPTATMPSSPGEPVDENYVWRGFNWSSAEFGEDHIAKASDQYGTTYIYGHDLAEGPLWTGALADRGLKLVRVGFRWERMQPEPFGAFDPDEVARMHAELDMIYANGQKALPYSHDYFHRQFEDGLYPIMPDGQGQVDVAAWIDFWSRFATEFGNHPAVLGLGLSNEPASNRPGSVDSSQPTYATYRDATERLIDRLRDEGYTGIINVPLWGYSTAYYAFERNPDLWEVARDHEDIWFEAHQYFDSDMSGMDYMTTFDDQVPAETGVKGAYVDLGVDRIEPFIQWINTARADGVNAEGYVGEYGVPGWPGTDPRWHELLDRFLNRLDEVGFHGTAWRAGVWWTEDPLWIGDYNAGGETGQMATLAGHPSFNFDGSFDPEPGDDEPTATPTVEPTATTGSPSNLVYSFDGSLEGHTGQNETAVTSDTGVFQDGSGSIKVSENVSGRDRYLNAAAPQLDEDWTEQGDTITAWVRVEDGGPAVVFNFAMHTTTWGWHESAGYNVAPGSWVKVSWTPGDNVMSEKRRLYYRVQTPTNPGQVTVWIDSVSIN